MVLFLFWEGSCASNCEGDTCEQYGSKVIASQRRQTVERTMLELETEAVVHNVMQDTPL